MSTIITEKHTSVPAANSAAIKPLFAVDYHVYINHTDAGGIVYHANHLVFFENCRRDWFTTLGLNTYFLQTDDGQIQHFVVNQVELQYRKAIFLDELISVRIDKIELKPASIIFYQSIHRNFPADSGLPDNMTNAKASLLSSAKIVIACVQNQAKGHESSSQSADKAAPSATPIRPIRVPEQLQDIIKQAMTQQSVQS